MSSDKRKSTDVNNFIQAYREKQEKKNRHKVFMVPLKIIMSVLFLIVGLYFIISAFFAFNSPMTTTLALNTSVNDEFSVAGYFVRRESLVSIDYDGILQYTASDGQKVAKNAPFASVYADKSAVETNRAIAALTSRITALEAALKASNDTTSTEKLAEGIAEQLLNVTEISDKGTYSLFSGPARNLKSLIVNREFAFAESAKIQSDIDDLKSQREKLRESLGERERVLYTPKAGYFISYTDGYEEVLNVAALDEMTVDELKSLGSFTGTSDAIGKIVTDFEWYFACTLRHDEVSELSEGASVTMQFDATSDLLINAKVYHIASKLDDETVVVFRGTDNLDKLMLLRKQAATIILHTYNGLKVPKSALRVDEDGNIGVYVITGLYAEFKKIEPIYETRDYYIVKTESSSTKSLLNNDIIIINGKELSDRKVLE